MSLFIPSAHKQHSLLLLGLSSLPTYLLKEIYSEMFAQSGNSQANKQQKNSTPLPKNV